MGPQGLREQDDGDAWKIFPLADEVDLEKAGKYRDMRLDALARADEFHSIQDQGGRDPFSFLSFLPGNSFEQHDYFEDQLYFTKADNRDISLGWWVDKGRAPRNTGVLVSFF